MAFFIFPTFCLSYLLGVELIQGVKGYSFVEDYLDFSECCLGNECLALGDGICDRKLSTKDCAWDMGDCGYCMEGCYLEMLDNGNCDEECNNNQCFYDNGECSRLLIELNTDGDSDNITINDKSVSISKTFLTKVDYFVFDDIEIINGTISYHKKEGKLFLDSIDLGINGKTVIDKFFVNNPENVKIKILNKGKVEFKNLCFLNVEFLINQKFLANLAVNKFKTTLDGDYICINLEVELLVGSFFLLEFKNSTGISKFKIKSTTVVSNTPQVLNLSNIEIPDNFEFSASLKRTKAKLDSSIIKIANYSAFKVSRYSTLQINSSVLEVNFTNDSENIDKGLFFYINSSKVIIIDSDLGDCNNSYVADLDENSSLELQKVTFTNCKYRNMTGISQMINCNNQTCDSEISYFRNCPDGQMDVIGCRNCPNGYYRFKKLNEIFCFNCPNSMICEDGTVKNNKEYYRFTKELDHVFRKCYNVGACNESDSCNDGYEGNFCAACKNGYTSIGRYLCDKCPKPYQNALMIFLMIAIASLFVIYMIKSTVISSFEVSEFYSIAMKIGINYFQVIYLCLQFRISWPSTNGKTEGNEGSDKLEGGSNLYFSFKCLFKDFEDHKSYYYARVTFMAILPIIICGFSIIYLVSLWLYRKFRNKKLNLTIYKPVTFIIPFLLVYPYVITYTLSPIACDSLENNKPTEFDEKIDYSKYRLLMEDPDIFCTWDEHYKKIIWATGFSLIVWGFGVPLYIFYKLYKQRKNLFKYEVKYTFGFLISGYLHERFYWEFIIFTKKLMIVFLTVFMQTGYSITLQSILLITFLIAGFILQIYYKPYITDELNRLDTLSTLAAIITVLAAIIYTESNTNSNTLRFFLVLVLILVNFFYIIYWISFISKEFFYYVVNSIDYLKKRFLRRDGFDPMISKEYITTDYVYVKEYQKLFTQAKLEDPVVENYLGERPTYNNLLHLIIKSNLEEYKNNDAPIIRAFQRQKTFKK